MPRTACAREHLADVRVPQLFVSGTRDPLARSELLRETVAALGRRARLLEVEGGDHSLARSRREPLAGAEVWLDAIAAFVDGLAARARRARG